MSLRKFKRRRNKGKKSPPGPDPIGLFNLGNQAAARGDRAAAMAAYHKALAVKPDYVEALDNLAVLLDAEGEVVAAVDLLRHSLALKVDNPLARNNLAASLLKLGLHQEALRECRAVLENDSEFIEAHNNLGTILMAMGDKDGSEAAFRKGLALDPHNASILRHLVLCRRYQSIDDPDMEMITAALAKSAAGGLDEMLLRFAAGKISEDCGEYDRAFAFFSRANEIRQGMVSYDRREYQRMIERIIVFFSADFFAKRPALPGLAELDRQPVFIVGMPRSGSTLVEQILASHPQVSGVGENLQVNRMIGQLCRVGKSLAYPEAVKGLSPKLLADAGRAYLDWLCTRVDDGVTLIVDKTLTNHLHLGLLHFLFPGARFIHCERNPLDIAVSLYSLYMPEVIYGGSLEDTAFVYQQESRLFDHWFSLDRGTGDPFILNVAYEELVDDLQGQSRKMVEFLGLDWDERCLDFHRNRRPVNTASAWQVRKPVYRTSVARWKNYADHLAKAAESGGFLETLLNRS